MFRFTIFVPHVDYFVFVCRPLSGVSIEFKEYNLPTQYYWRSSAGFFHHNCKDTVQIYTYLIVLGVFV